MKYFDVMRRVKALDLPKDRSLKYSIGKVRPHSRLETFEHFLVKATLTKVLQDKGIGVVSECEFANGRVVDVLGVYPNSFVAYEIESKGENTKCEVPDVDEMVIDLRNIPKDVVKSIDFLRKWIEEQVV